jgi:hypothetical protein
MKPAAPARFSENAAFLRVMADALSIQERFSAEPVYAKTGKGFLKSAGTSELKKIKEREKSRKG